MILTNGSVFKSMTRALTVALFTSLLVAIPNSADAAYCSLRDPVIAIRALYPDATQHRSIVRPIDQTMRRKIATLLPFTLHYKELNRHTLYLIKNQEKPIGFVQARSEASDWGLVEFAWAISPDMEIDGMVLQRCRGPECNAALKRQVERLVYGKSFAELLALLGADGMSFSAQAQSQLPDAQPLLLTILRSALKTLAVTELAWGDVIDISRTTIYGDHSGTPAAQ